MFSPDDTIVAIASPPGRGGIGVVRVSGPRALEIAGALITRPRPLEARRATFTRLRGARGGTGTLDEVIITAFPAPHSYTGQDVVEISAHGAPVVLHAIVRNAIGAGARLAQPGEFTLRAFLSGKLDLVQAEAVADLIAAATPLQARMAFDQLEGTLTRRIAAIDAELFDLIARLEASLDFPDEGYHFIDPAETESRIASAIDRIAALLADAASGRMIREGATVVIAGRPNVGKSSLFNVLAGHERAIVTAVPGTTRDLVTEQVDLDGLAVTLVDTAGWREATDLIEQEGVTRGVRARDVAAVVLLVVDASAGLTADDQRLLEETATARRVVVANKSDLVPAVMPRLGRPVIAVSAATGSGIPELRRALVQALTGEETLRDTAAVSNIRHVRLLEDARDLLARARSAAASGATPEEFLLADLQGARERFDAIVGVRTPEDVLRHIFERFCIGK